MSDEVVGTIVVAESGYVGSEIGRYRGKNVDSGDIVEDYCSRRWRIVVASGLGEIDEKLYAGRAG